MLPICVKIGRAYIADFGVKVFEVGKRLFIISAAFAVLKNKRGLCGTKCHCLSPPEIEFILLFEKFGHLKIEF